MWFGGLLFAFAALLVTFGSAVVGGFFSLIAWIGVVSNLPKGKRSQVPAMLYTFSASSFLALAGFILFVNITPDPSGTGFITNESLPRLWTFFMVAGFVFVLITMLLAYLYAGPGRRFILVGTVLLFLIDVLGFALTQGSP